MLATLLVLGFCTDTTPARVAQELLGLLGDESPDIGFQPVRVRESVARIDEEEARKRQAELDRLNQELQKTNELLSEQRSETAQEKTAREALEKEIAALNMASEREKKRLEALLAEESENVSRLRVSSLRNVEDMQSQIAAISDEKNQKAEKIQSVMANIERLESELRDKTKLLTDHSTVATMAITEGQLQRQRFNKIVGMLQVMTALVYDKGGAIADPRTKKQMSQDQVLAWIECKAQTPGVLGDRAAEDIFGMFPNLLEYTNKDQLKESWAPTSPEEAAKNESGVSVQRENQVVQPPAKKSAVKSQFKK